MKKYILIVMMLSVFMSAIFAIEVSFADAKLVAENFLEYKDIDSALTSINDKSFEFYYVFSFENGYVITSQETRIEPIIAYSTINSFSKNERLLQILQQDLQFRNKYITENPQRGSENEAKWEMYLSGNLRNDRNFQQWPPAGTTITDGWVEETWNQSGVFNNFCPLDDSGERSVVGCVATAMAMIIDFHEYVGEPFFDDSDAYYSGWGGYGGIHIDGDHEENDFPTFEELNDYLDVLDDHYENGIELTADDLAALNFSAGISVEMMYSSSGSGTYTYLVPNALINKYDYDSGYWKDESDYDFYEVFANEMKNMHPAPMSIYQAGWEGGHAIIADGYNTDDFFHLNFGWGTSNNTCWYSLPQGMPSNYSIITGAGMNIEAGIAPVQISGNVLGIDNPLGTVLTFEGPTDYHYTITNVTGEFEIEALLPGTYTITALKQRDFYQSIEIDITEDNQEIEIMMGEFEALTGSVNGECDLNGVNLNLFDEDDKIIATGITNSEGTFSIPNILPGNYKLIASQSEGYFGITNFSVSLEDQDVDLEMNKLNGSSYFSFAKYPSDLLTLPNEFTLSCAIKLDETSLNSFTDSAISGVRFKSPINQENGEITAQLWQGNTIISEKEIINFAQGEWLDIEFDMFSEVKPEQDYYIGYRIHTISGEVAYHDNGPRVSNNAAYLRTSSWVSLSTIYDYNFCIEPKIIHNNFGTITGNINSDTLMDSYEDIAVKAGNYITHPNEVGNFEIELLPGEYSLEILAENVNNLTTEVIQLDLGQTENITINLTDNENETTEAIVDKLFANYPNPFNPSTTIRFNIANENEPVKLKIFNLKGQLVKTLIDKKMKAGTHSVQWFGTDQNQKQVASGFYLYRLETSSNALTKKALLLK